MENRNRNIILKHHNKVTEARYEMTALEKNIVYMVMAQFKDGEPPRRSYFVSIQELKNKLKELGEVVNLEQVQEATGKLVTRVFVLTEDSGDYIQMGLFASVIYTDDSDLVEVKLSKSARHYMFNLKYDFTSYELNSALSLRSTYSKRIYEMLSQHKNPGIFKISVQELKERLKIIDPVNKIEKLKVWSVFAKNVLELAKKEINEKTDLSTHYTLKKTGAKFTDIEFYISKK